MVKPSSSRTSAMPLMPMPPTPTKCRCWGLRNIFVNASPCFAEAAAIRHTESMKPARSGAPSTAFSIRGEKTFLYAIVSASGSPVNQNRGAGFRRRNPAKTVGQVDNPMPLRFRKTGQKPWGRTPVLQRVSRPASVQLPETKEAGRGRPAQLGRAAAFRLSASRKTKWHWASASPIPPECPPRARPLPAVQISAPPRPFSRSRPPRRPARRPRRTASFP